MLRSQSLLGCRQDVSRSAPVLPSYEGMQISFIEAPPPAHLMAHELPGSKPAMHRCPTYPEQLSSLLKGKKNILSVNTFQ